MKKSKIATSLSIALLAGAPVAMNAEDCCMPEYMPGEILCDGCAGYSQYAGVELDCGWDVFARGEFLYWRPYNATNVVAVAIPQNTSTQPQLELGHKYGWKPGFSVGLGMVAHCFDDWIFNVDYTRFHNSFTKTFSETLPTILASTIASGTPFSSSIRDKWHFHYDVVELSFQRPNYLGQRVIVSPMLGFKWLKKDNLVSQDLVDPTGAVTNASTKLKYTSFGITAGFDGSWLLCWNLSLIGKAEAALLYPYQRSLVQIITPPAITVGTPVAKTRHHIRHLDIYARGGFGIGWGSYFCCRRYHLNLSATYEWMGDVVKMDFLSGMFQNGTTALMGLTVRGQFDF